MAVREVVVHEVHLAIGGLVIHDRQTDDWLVLLSPYTTPGERRAILKDLTAQLGRWDRLGHSTTEVRAYLARMVW
jgi:hypothetical protein